MRYCHSGETMGSAGHLDLDKNVLCGDVGFIQDVTNLKKICPLILHLILLAHSATVGLKQYLCFAVL